MRRTIDCSEIKTKERLHQALAQTLALPEDYGKNLDALYDALTALGEETELVFLNAAAIAEMEPQNYFEKVLRVLNDATAENSKFRFCMKEV